MTTVLVTGATGFLGRHVVTALSRRPDLTVLVGPTASSHAEGRGHRFNLSAGWPSGLPHVDAVIHLAWAGLDDFRSPIHLAQVDHHERFLAGALRSGTSRLVVVGTCLEYGLREGELGEDLTPSPVVAYARAKTELEQRLSGTAERLGAGLMWTRVFYPYGPGQSPRALWSVVQRAIDQGSPEIDMSPGDQMRDFLPAAEVAGILARLATAEEAPSGPVNVCSGTPRRVADMAAEWIADRGATVRMNLGVLGYPDYEPHAFWGSTARLSSILDGRRADED